MEPEAHHTIQKQIYHNHTIQKKTTKTKKKHQTRPHQPYLMNQNTQAKTTKKNTKARQKPN